MKTTITKQADTVKPLKPELDDAGYVTVEITVWHGNYHKTECASADDCESALNLALRTPMGIGYGPKAGSEQFQAVCAELEAKGQAQHGWANYRLIKHSPACSSQAEKAGD